MDDIVSPLASSRPGLSHGGSDEGCRSRVVEIGRLGKGKRHFRMFYFFLRFLQGNGHDVCCIFDTLEDALSNAFFVDSWMSVVVEI